MAPCASDKNFLLHVADSFEGKVRLTQGPVSQYLQAQRGAPQEKESSSNSKLFQSGIYSSLCFKIEIKSLSHNYSCFITKSHCLPPDLLTLNQKNNTVSQHSLYWATWVCTACCFTLWNYSGTAGCGTN